MKAGSNERAAFTLVSYLTYYSNPEDGGDMFLRNVALTFRGLHSIISQTAKLFITTAVRTSNPTCVFRIGVHVSTLYSIDTKICFLLY
jgi:hypothetical protein